MGQQISLSVDWGAVGVIGVMLVAWTGAVIFILRWFLLREIQRQDEKFESYEQDKARNTADHHTLEIKFMDRYNQHSLEAARQRMEDKVQTTLLLEKKFSEVYTELGKVRTEIMNRLNELIDKGKA